MLDKQSETLSHSFISGDIDINTFLQVSSCSNKYIEDAFCFSLRYLSIFSSAVRFIKRHFLNFFIFFVYAFSLRVYFIFLNQSFSLSHRSIRIFVCLSAQLIKSLNFIFKFLFFDFQDYLDTRTRFHKISLKLSSLSHQLKNISHHFIMLSSHLCIPSSSLQLTSFFDF